MPKFKATVYTLAELSVEVDVEDEDKALDVAYERAREFSGLYLDGHDYKVSLNNEWQLREAEVTEL